MNESVVEEGRLAQEIRDDVAFFQAVCAVLRKRAPGDTATEEDLDHAIRQIHLFRTPTIGINSTSEEG